MQSKFHFVQNVLLISIPGSEKYFLEDLQDLSDKKIIDIASNKNQYNVRDMELEFDVLIKHGSKLYYFSYDHNGKFNELKKTKEVSDGFFGFRAEPTDQDYSYARIGSKKFFLTVHSDANGVNLKEVAEFIKINNIEHFKLWGLVDDDLDCVKVQHHIKSLFDACQHMYIMREEENKQIVAMRGLTLTPTCDLGFRSIAVTKYEYRGNGLAATIFQQMVNQYHDAVFIGYISNKELHKKLSLDAMIQPNENNIPISEKMDLKNVVVCTPEKNWIPPTLCS
jgi:hypothetical protein